MKCSNPTCDATVVADKDGTVLATLCDRLSCPIRDEQYVTFRDFKITYGDEPAEEERG